MRGEVGFIAPVEGLRGVAVLLVVLFHYAMVLDTRFSDPWLAAIDGAIVSKVVVRNGMLGVDLFFLITGFLLVLPWIRQQAEGGARPSVAGFYRRRVQRILPAYYVQLLVLFFVFVPLLRGLEFWRYNPTYLLENLSAHIFLVHYFSPVTSASVSINGSLWSLAIEAQFYLLLPFLAPVFARAPLRTAGAMLACAIAWRWGALSHMDGWVAAIQAVEPRWNVPESTARHLLYTQLPGYLGHFAAGMLAAHAWWSWRDREHPPLPSLAWLSMSIAAGATLWGLHAPGGWILGEATWVLALAGLALIFLALVTRALPLADRALSRGPFALVGRVSYSVYLYHLPLLLLLNAFAPEITGSWLVLPLYLAGVGAVAWISYRYVEVPSPAGARARASEPTRSAVTMASAWSAATPHRTSE